MEDIARPVALRYDAWCRRTDGLLLWLAMAFLVVFILPLYFPDLPEPAQRLFFAVNVVIWLAFAGDYATRLWLAPDRWMFVRKHGADLLTLAVPFLRPLRLLRVVGMLTTASRRAGKGTQLRITTYLVSAVATLLLVCAGLVLDAERDADGANITTAGDALWWAATTVTTVGYGDRYPTTNTGRLVAVLLMLGGIALLGVITASVAAWFISQFTALGDIEDAVDAEALSTAVAMEDMAGRLRRIEDLLLAVGPLVVADALRSD